MRTQIHDLSDRLDTLIAEFDEATRGLFLPRVPSADDFRSKLAATEDAVAQAEAVILHLASYQTRRMQ